MKKKVIKTDFTPDFKILALATELKDFQLAWHINKALSISLERIEDHKVIFTKGENLLSTQFYFQHEYLTVRMLQNKCLAESSKNYIIPELKNIDFFILIKDETKELEILNVKSTLSKIKNVILVQEIDFQRLKSIENLIGE